MFLEGDNNSSLLKLNYLYSKQRKRPDDAPFQHSIFAALNISTRYYGVLCNQRSFLDEWVNQ